MVAWSRLAPVRFAVHIAPVVPNDIVVVYLETRELALWNRPPDVWGV
jgi:hypothetical protein